MKPTSIYTRNVPPTLKTQFKAWCATKGYTMEAAVVALLQKAVYENPTLFKAHKAVRQKEKRNE